MATNVTIIAQLNLRPSAMCPGWAYPNPNAATATMMQPSTSSERRVFSILFSMSYLF